LRRFLKHVVSHSLTGDDYSLKEYTVGVDVFDRGTCFDPRDDAIVRVEARRLREKLRTYYRTEGATDPVTISIPPGAYRPRFHLHKKPPAAIADGVRTVKRIDLAAVPRRKGSMYPHPFDTPCREHVRQAIGDAAGLDGFGINLLQLPPGAWSSQRHWHSTEDEFTWVVQGEVVLITDDGEEVLRAGDCAGFKAGVPNGHHLQNRSNAAATVLEIGSRRPDEDVCIYSDIDMQWGPAGITRKDGTAY
jgi:uncharacterized cupin superfamily protein